MKTESGGEGGRDMAFELEKYTAPDFAALGLESAADARTAEAPLDGVAPENYHAMSIFPEYFRVGGKWVLAAESRMDCVPVLTDGGRVDVREPRRLKKGERVFTGRTEDGSQGIFVWPYGFEQKKGNGDVFAFRQGRSRETAFSRETSAEKPTVPPISSAREISAAKSARLLFRIGGALPAACVSCDGRLSLPSGESLAVRASRSKSSEAAARAFSLRRKMFRMPRFACRDLFCVSGSGILETETVGLRFIRRRRESVPAFRALYP